MVRMLEAGRRLPVLSQEKGVRLEVGGGRPASDEEDQEDHQHQYQPGGDGSLPAAAPAAMGAAQLAAVKDTVRVDGRHLGNGGGDERGRAFNRHCGDHGRCQGRRGGLGRRDVHGRRDGSGPGRGRQRDPDRLDRCPAVSVPAPFPAIPGDGPTGADADLGSAPFAVDALGAARTGPPAAAIGAVGGHRSFGFDGNGCTAAFTRDCFRSTHGPILPTMSGRRPHVLCVSHLPHTLTTCSHLSHQPPSSAWNHGTFKSRCTPDRAPNRHSR